MCVKKEASSDSSTSCLQCLSACLTPPPPSPLSHPLNPVLDQRQVTMTDLPEALPILRHNTEATFRTLIADDGSLSQGRTKAGHAAAGLLKACRRPTIRQLSWGDDVEAGEVAAVAAAAAAAAAAAMCVEEEKSEWRGFDLIVVREMRGRKDRGGAVPGGSRYR